MAAIGGGVGGALGGGAPTNWATAARQAVVANVITQGIGVATGLQKQFSWAGVAAAGIGAAVAEKFVPTARLQALAQAGRNSSAYLSAFAQRGAASALASAATRSLIEGSDFGDNIMAALPDVIGQTIGEAIAGGISKQMEEARAEREWEERVASWEGTVDAAFPDSISMADAAAWYGGELTPVRDVRWEVAQQAGRVGGRVGARQGLRAIPIIGGILADLFFADPAGAERQTFTVDEIGGDVEFSGNPGDTTRWSISRRVDGQLEPIGQAWEGNYGVLTIEDPDGVSELLGRSLPFNVVLLDRAPGSGEVHVGGGIETHNQDELDIVNNMRASRASWNDIHNAIQDHRYRTTGAAGGGRPPGDVFVVGNHGDMPSPRPGQESHHGVMSKWMSVHFPGYNPDLAPAILMPEANHHATFGVYNTWRAEQKRAMGGRFSWERVSETEIRSLSNRMLDAARVPQPIRNEYWQRYEAMRQRLQNNGQ